MTPWRFTRSYSGRCVRRRVFGNAKELTFVVCVAGNSSPQQAALRRAHRFAAHNLRTKEVFHRKSEEDFSNEKIRAIYCAGDSAGVSSAPAGDSVVVAGASVAAGLVISVAAGAVVGAGVVAGATVSVFCSHAASSAAPARMQMYFFIVGEAYCFNRSIAASVVFRPHGMLLATQMARREH